MSDLSSGMKKGEITEQLIRIKLGDDDAQEKLYGIVYSKLQQVAAYELSKERKDHTMNRTDLVHETFLKLINLNDIDWKDRRHFFRIAARAMKQILIDHARKKLSSKRGNNPHHIELNEEIIKLNSQSTEIIEISEALEELRKVDERLAEVVDLRFFAGLSMDDIGDVMEISRSTVNRDWVKARAWLYNRLNKSG